MGRMRTLLVLGALMGCWEFVGTLQARAQTPEINRRVNFVNLLLLQQQRSLRSESRILNQQNQSILRLIRLEQLTSIAPQQQRLRERLIQRTQAQILSLQRQIDRVDLALRFKQAVLDQSVSSLGSLVANNPGLAQLVRRLQQQAATMQQAVRVIVGRSQITPFFPG
jgi:Flp pilus assembly protein CpaB